MIGRTARGFAIGSMALAVLTAGTPTLAQDGNDEARLRKLEGEVRALQRKVFPGSDGRYFEAEISAPQTTRPSANGSSTTAVTDILARLDALEMQIQRLTSNYEENGNAMRLLSERVDMLEGSGTSGNVDLSASTSVPATTPAVTVTTPAARIAVVEAPAARAVPASSGPSADRVAAVQAIAKPQTDDAGDDEYSYGYRLWDAGFHPEAQQALTMFVEKYPSHWRLSYARNLLGRAYLDDGKAREAAPWFLKNYQSNKSGERAGDSLLYLAEAMIELKDTGRACIALAEFGETYPALAAGRLQGQYETDRRKVKCN
ncbi:tetratricopeptide repeat protein [Qipengyuania marisflavi]|uniref:Tetratricopeptide repeat protein n=1 Tax=Qipengyuania marisflavi TaxID=2486356 RepID=A0A5S3P361_9SPHN|nr:tetratricopeptide repeat protein [Qipengyuania marisflavi]TMM47369.1 tetratricopeptide repeat protein [Qipengyuania marisflavi]